MSVNIACDVLQAEYEINIYFNMANNLKLTLDLIFNIKTILKSAM